MLARMDAPEDRPPHPLERLSAGGWKGGLLRLALAVGVVALVIHFGGTEAWARLAEPRMIPVIAGGAALHLVQRAVRVAKWQAMLSGAGLYRNDYGYLLRAQLVGMLANLVAPVSEGVKVWAVSRTRAQAITATASLATDTALHAGAIASAGLLGIVVVGSRDPWVWGGAGGMLLTAVAVIAGVKLWGRAGVRDIRHVGLALAGWLSLETLLQLAVFALALTAIGLSPTWARLLALAPLLYLADLVVVTPSGLGVREALFGATLALLDDAPSDAGIAAGLLVSAMIFVAVITGGVGATVWSGRHPHPPTVATAPKAEPGEPRPKTPDAGPR